MPPGHHPNPIPVPGPAQPFTSPRRRHDRTGGAAGGTLRPGPAAPNLARRPSPPAWTARRREEGRAQLAPASLALAPEPASHPADLGQIFGRARRTRFCDTQSARTAARPSPGAARPGRLGAGRLRWRGWAKEIKNKMTFCRRRKSPLSNPWEKCPTPCASHSAPPFGCALHQKVEWGRGGRALGTGFEGVRSFQGWDPRRAGPSSPHRPSPTPGSSLLHLDCLVPQGPGAS